MNLSKIVANNIKYIRIINSMSQEELANRMDINQANISAIGKVSLERLEK